MWTLGRSLPTPALDGLSMDTYAQFIFQSTLLHLWGFLCFTGLQSSWILLLFSHFHVSHLKSIVDVITAQICANVCVRTCACVRVCVCLLPGVCILQGPSVLPCWPSAWNEKCLMPLVCSEGLSLFPKMDSHALLITKHSCNGILSFKHSWIFALFFFLSFCLTDLQFMHVLRWLVGCMTACLLRVMFCFCPVFFFLLCILPTSALDSPSHPLPSVPCSTQWEAKR